MTEAKEHSVSRASQDDVGGRADSSNRLDAIARGAHVQTATHEAVTSERPVLETAGFNFWYGDTRALYDINMAMPEGKITAIIGPSGCGKSTLLRSINRLNDLLDDVQIEGDILLNGDSIYGKSVDVIELRKRMGMVFQKSNPFPMSIYDNVVYPLTVDGIRDRSVLHETCRQSLVGAALWDEVKDRLNESAL
jgi:phosphate transport system ATP-binding protein